MKAHSRPARILIIGLGHFGQEHCKEWSYLARHGKVLLAGAVTATKISRDRMAKKWHIPVYHYSELKDNLLKGIDGVDIVTPSNTHARLVRRFIKHCHVLVEKPLSTSKSEAQELLRLSLKHDRVLMVGHVFRFHPLIKKLKQLVSEIPVSPCGIYGTFTNPKAEVNESVDPNLEFLHLYDIIDFLFERAPEIYYGRYRDSTCHINLRYPEHTTAYLKIGWEGNDKIRSLTLRYSDRRIVSNLVENVISVFTHDNQVDKIILPGKPLALRKELSSFVQAIISKKTIVSDAEVGARVIDIAVRATPKRLKRKPRIAIIGAGIFGVTCALELSKLGEISLFERHSDIFTEASHVNQWRHHSGFHYPISYEVVLEIQRAKVDFESYYGGAIRRDIPSYFCTSRFAKEIPAERYLSACQCANLNFKIEQAPEKALDPRMVSICLKTDEGVYDFDVLKDIANKKLQSDRNISLYLESAVVNGSIEKNGDKLLKINKNGHLRTESFDYVVNATYANWHVMSKWFDFPINPIRLERVELLLLRVPLDQMCITLIDAPFHSLVGTGKENLFLLAHRDHSVIKRVVSTDGMPVEWGRCRSNRKNILRDAIRYMPILKKAKVVESWFVTKAISAYERDFYARPTIVIHQGFGCWSVLGGKIITCVTNAKEITSQIQSELIKK